MERRPLLVEGGIDGRWDSANAWVISTIRRYPVHGAANPLRAVLVVSPVLPPPPPIPSAPRLPMRLCRLLQLVVATALWAAAPTSIDAQPAPDRAGAERAALDYIEGFYEGDTVKLYRSVSPEVLKFGYSKGRDGSWQHVPFPWPSFGSFAAAVRAGRNLPPANAPKRVVLYDVQEQIAAARVDAWWGMDYLLMARMDGRWKITHVLWQGPPPNNR